VKRCTKCGQDKPLSEFYVYKGKPESACKECVRAAARERRRNESSEVKRARTERQRQRRAEHPDEYHAKNREYYAKNRERILAAANQYRTEHPDRRREQHRRHYEANKAKYHRAAADFAHRDPEGRRAIKHRSLARRHGRQATLTVAQWQDILAAFGYACAYCGRGWHEITGKLNQEHVIPVSQDGGYTVDNIVPACGACNTRKAGRTPEQAGMTLRQPLFDYKGKHSDGGNHPAKNDSAAA
jgi:5-methylcytosine-specific restriction endonuclease McrA